jgi:hypothetical protein
MTQESTAVLPVSIVVSQLRERSRGRVITLTWRRAYGNELESAAQPDRIHGFAVVGIEFAKWAKTHASTLQRRQLRSPSG